MCDELDQFTISLRFLSAAMRTFLLAGLALNIIFSPVKGLTPSRALVAGFFTTFIFRSPGSVNSPPPRRLFLITPLSESKTLPTCLRDSPVSLEMLVRTSDFVGAPPFFAICGTPREFWLVAMRAVYSPREENRREK